VSGGDVGFVEWFRPGEHERVEEVLAGLSAAGATRLRTHISWADHHADGGPEWFDWLIPRLGAAIDLLPCVHYTPPSISRTGRTTGAPRDLKSYADFTDMLLTRHGAHFSHVELWNEPNNLLDWDWREDKNYDLFSEMAGAAAYWIRERGWKAVLGGPCPFDPLWLELMGQRGVLAHCAAVGFHGFPGTWDSEEASWRGWDMHLGEMRAILDRWTPEAEIWITEAGYSTWRNDEMEQARRFAQALEAPADRLYWYAWRDLPPESGKRTGLHARFRRWAIAGIRERLFNASADDPDAEYVLMSSAIPCWSSTGQGAIAISRALSGPSGASSPSSQPFMAMRNAVTRQTFSGESDPGSLNGIMSRL